MARFYLASLDANHGLFFHYRAIADGVTITEGMECSEDVSGRAIAGVSGSGLLGIHVGPDRTGNTAGTVLAQIVPAKDYPVRIARPSGIAVVDCQPGDQLDLKSNSIDVDALVNADFVVRKYDETNDEIILKALNPAVL